jgi:hypothetical protein
MKFLKVDGIAGDRMKKKIRARETWQRVAARFVAVCRFHGTRKFVNPVAKNEI